MNKQRILKRRRDRVRQHYWKNFSSLADIRQKYLQEPTYKSGQGKCGLAVQDTIRELIKQGTPKENIKILKIRTESARGGPSNHFVVKANDKYYDFANMQYSPNFQKWDTGVKDIEKGIYDHLPSTYKVVGEQRIEPYL